MSETVIGSPEILCGDLPEISLSFSFPSPMGASSLEETECYSVIMMMEEREDLPGPFICH